VICSTFHDILKKNCTNCTAIKRPKIALCITGKQYLNLVLLLRFVVVVVVNKLSEDGVLLPEHVEVGTNWK